MSAFDGVQGSCYNAQKFQRLTEPAELSMKAIACLSLAILFLFSYALTHPTTAAKSGPSANGDFWFSAGDGVTRYVKFNAKVNPDGTSKGEMTYVDPAATPEFDLDNPEGSSSASAGVTIRIQFDCLVVNGNHAVMSGVIVDSGFPNSIGQRVLLTVEDNDEGIKAPGLDRLSWGVYKNAVGGWVPSDAEQEHGPVAPWQATDFERSDDAGYMSNRSTTISCNSFPLSSYSFIDVTHGGGNVQVKP